MYTSYAYAFIHNLHTCTCIFHYIHYIHCIFPVKDISNILKKVFQKYYSSLPETTEYCIKKVAEALYSRDLISKTVEKSPTFDSISSEFEATMNLCKTIEDLSKCCKSFLECMSSQGGPAKLAANQLGKQWEEEVKEKFDIAFNVIQKDCQVEDATGEIRVPEKKQSCDLTECIITEECCGSKVTLPPSCEEEIGATLEQLRNTFDELYDDFIEQLEDNIENGKTKLVTVTKFVQRYTARMSQEVNIHAQGCETVDDLMEKIKNMYDFLDCEIISAIAKKFAPEMSAKFEAHSLHAKEFRKSTSVQAFANGLKKIYYKTNTDTNLPIATIDLKNVWNRMNIDGLYILINRFFPNSDRQSLLKHIKVTTSSVHIEYHMTESPLEVLQIIADAEENISFLRLIGIYGFKVNDHTVLQDQYNHMHEDIILESSLFKAVKSGDNKAVKFLIDVGIDVNYTDVEDKTPLMLAVDEGHELVVRTLISAKANINAQTKLGLTALARAVSYGKPIALIKCLLENGANPNVIVNETSILDMATDFETRQLLLHYEAKTTDVLTIVEHRKALRTFLELRDHFEILKATVLTVLKDLVITGSIDFTEVKRQLVGSYIHERASCQDIHELIALIQPHSFIFNVELLKFIVQKFILGGYQHQQIVEYQKCLEEFEKNTQVCHLCAVFLSEDKKALPPSVIEVTAELSYDNKYKTVNDLRTISQQCFPLLHRYLNLVNVKEKSSTIKCFYTIPSSQHPTFAAEWKGSVRVPGVLMVCRRYSPLSDVDPSIED